MPKPVSPDSRTEGVANPEHDLESGDTLANIGVVTALTGGLLFGVVWIVGDRFQIDPLPDIGLFGVITCWAVATIFWLLFAARVAIGK